uniref:Uncharacterized protein n=1 Tax=Anopheles albimanus TaxID=7167 RepID=A0A182FUA7_ANOAL
MYEVATLTGSKLLLDAPSTASSYTSYTTSVRPRNAAVVADVESPTVVDLRNYRGYWNGDVITMGQISSSATTATSSNNNNNGHPHHGTVTRNGKKIYHRHSSVQPALASIRLLKKENSFTAGSGGGTAKDTSASAGVRLRESMQKARTESKNIDQYGVLLGRGGSGTANETSGSTAVPAPPCPSCATTASNDLTTLLSSESAGEVVDRSVSSVVGGGSSSREFFKSGDDTYHRTECCYYRTMDNGYHKLPSDSYHKTTEGCYVKLPDGSFRRLMDPATTAGSATTVGGGAGGDEDTAPVVAAPVQYRVRNPMLKFLKRSKSHTPTTIAQLRKEKEERERKEHHRLSTIQSSDVEANRHQAATAAAVLLQSAHHTAGPHRKGGTADSLTKEDYSQIVLARAREGRRWRASPGTGINGQQQQQNGAAADHHAHHHHHHHHHHHQQQQHHHHNSPSAASIVEQQQQQQGGSSSTTAGATVVTNNGATNSSGSKPSSTGAAAVAPANHPNRRVMVTMIDGGLPVVAKSKPIHDKVKSAKARAQDVKRDKLSVLSQAKKEKKKKKKKKKQEEGI